jgi:metallo-beta-lactamase class B
MNRISALPTILMIALTSLHVSAQSTEPKLKITHLTGDCYVYITYNLWRNQPVPSNSMYLVTNEGVVMFDTPWDTTQFQPLLDSIEARHHKKVIMSISTHFHEDRTGGIDFLRAKGIKTYSSRQTYDLCKQRREKQAEYYFTKDTTFNAGNYSIQAYYPGAGHTPDNIVIWVPREKVLYGGCLVKSTEATSLGNLSDANLQAWPNSIQKVMQKYPSPAYIIPGHDGWSNNQSLQHTLQLLKAHKDKAPQ